MKFMKLRKLLPIIGILIFILILRKLDWQQITHSFENIQLIYILLSILIAPILICFQTLKWALILKKQDINLPFWDLIKIQVISAFYGVITPGRFGYFIKVIYLKEKAKISIAKSLTSIIVDRLIDFMVVFILGAIGSIVVINYYANITSHIIIAVITLFTIEIIFASKKVQHFFIKFIIRFIVPSKFKDQAKGFFGEYLEHSLNPFKQYSNLLLTLFVWVLIYTQLYLVALSFNIREINYLYFLILPPIATMVSLIPITISGLGTREATLMGLFSLFRIPATKIFLMSLLNTLVCTIIGLVGGFFALKEEKLIEEVKEEAKKLHTQHPKK